MDKYNKCHELYTVLKMRDMTFMLNKRLYKTESGMLSIWEKYRWLNKSIFDFNVEELEQFKNDFLKIGGFCDENK